MSKIKIFLADLTHTGMGIATENMPLGIGLIASYAKKIHGDSVEFKLFKYPEKLLSALKLEKPDILGCASYSWNSNLSEWACKKAKQLYPDILTVQGGPHFPSDDLEEQTNFLCQRPDTDTFVKLEGEIAFSEIIKIFLLSGRSGVLSEPIPGCNYLDRKLPSPKLVVGPDIPRIQELDEIPSPYLNGMLDEFFDGHLSPVIQTVRGCPFTCDFCNSGASYYNKIKTFSDQKVFLEIDYITEKITSMEKETGKCSGILTIADDNFGMYPRDKGVAQLIADKSTSLGWPRFVVMFTGKNRVERVTDAISSLKNIMTQSMAMQSLNQDTLESIGRGNMKIVQYEQRSKNSFEQGIQPNCELIIPLPHETLKTYFDGIRKVINVGNMRIITYTLQMNYGTPYRNKEFIEKHGYKSKYRLITKDSGKYDGEFVAETEMVPSETKYMSFEDYLEIRCFTLYMETFYNQLFDEFIQFVFTIKLSGYDFMDTIRTRFQKHASKNLNTLRDNFLKDTASEMMDSEEALYEFYSKSENYEQLMQGLIGINVTFKHKAMAIGNHLNDLMDYVNSCVKTLILKSEYAKNDDYHVMLDCVKRYVVCKMEGFLNSDSKSQCIYEGEFDIKKWLDDKTNKPISHFKYSTKTVFDYSASSKDFRDNLFELYGDSMVGKITILSRIHNINKILRDPIDEGEKVLTATDYPTALPVHS